MNSFFLFFFSKIALHRDVHSTHGVVINLSPCQTASSLIRAGAQFISTFSTKNRLLAHRIVGSKVITALILRYKSFFADFLFFILMQHQCWGRLTTNQPQHWHIRNIYDRFRFKLNFRMVFDNAHGSINAFIFRLSSPCFTIHF